jgi:D-lactate dehydrogenase
MAETAPIRVAVFDTKPYDREFFLSVETEVPIDWHFREFRLGPETVDAVGDMQAAVVFVNDQIDRTCLEKLKTAGVGHVALRCAGFNNVDLDAAQELGIPITRVPAYSPHAVAEHAVALLMALNRRIHRAHSRVRELNFSLKGLVGFDLHGKTVGIVGTGKIGRLAAEIFGGFGTTVLAYDPYPTEDWAADRGVNYVPLAELVSRSDVISLHLPLTPATMHLFDHDQFARVKSGAYLVNTSRGKLIDTTAMIDNLKSGRLGGVALDVYEEEEGVFFEDLSDTIMGDDELSRLLTFPNVLITAHQAFLTKEALAEIARVTAANVGRIATGQPALEDTRLESS